MGRLGVDDLEDVRSCVMSLEEQQELIDAARQCVYTYTTPSGWPLGVVMSYLYADGAFWLTAVRPRKHVLAAARDPRVSLVIMNNGTELDGRRMCTVKGEVTVHDDRATLDWFLPRFAAHHQPGSPDAFVRLLDSENRVVLRVDPVAVPVSHDSRKIAGDGRGS